MGPDPLTVVALPPEIGPAPFDVDEIRAAQDDADTTDETVRERFRIENDEVAEWAMRKLAKATSEVDRLKAERDAYLAQVKAWHAQETKTPERDAKFFEAILEDYARRERADHDRKSVSLPSGAVRTKEQPPALEIDDEDALTSWLMGHGYHELVTLSTGVRKVSPVATIVAEPAPITQAAVDLQCGHTIVTDLDFDPEDDPTAEAVRLETALSDEKNRPHACTECSPWDPPEVQALNVTPITGPEVLVARTAAEGLDIPGLRVRPAGVSVSAKPNRAGE